MSSLCQRLCVTTNEDCERCGEQSRANVFSYVSTDYEAAHHQLSYAILDNSDINMKKELQKFLLRQYELY
ncbi:unnamed protein product [Litomosoides sigmodontis]|uniref:Uncharacterized protein n=1 Tax=Litomosoides sigmodontis TaxID=42156 RepID=A0A3P6U2E2_LITSI|nr:unnamed protein product [Litomosoides sigmodontis]